MREITAINIDLDVTHTSAEQWVSPEAQAKGVLVIECVCLCVSVCKRRDGRGADA